MTVSWYVVAILEKKKKKDFFKTHFSWDSEDLIDGFSKEYAFVNN